MYIFQNINILFILQILTLELDYFCYISFKINNMSFHSNKESENYMLKISGLVQGVGFRPFIYKLALENNFKGWVENRNDGVLININCTSTQAESFKLEILERAPIASNIFEISINQIEKEDFNSFKIKKSESISEAVTEISPDIAVCDNCLLDLKQQKHRINYPFINCTNCGPRFTIIKSLPYDRPKTTMQEFKMCKDCNTEYTEILDRRFHAQPIACNNCGPIYSLLKNGKTNTDLDEILHELNAGIKVGKIYAIKGLGGYNIMCDALNNDAVSKLRELKLRDGKPFAVMFNSLESLNEYTFINEIEEKEITSWQRPIVLLKQKKELAPDVCNGLSHIGSMLPYMPFHYLLFENIETDVLVLTSGNLSSEPIILSNEEAIEKFENKVDGIITYNRDIFNRTDDSVITINNSVPRIIRRSRGNTPAPIRTQLNVEGIFAAGAELVNSFAIGKGKQAILSQYIGDLKNFETFDFYKETYERFERLFRFKPEIIVRDLHPNYLSSQYTEILLKKYPDAKLLKVQHHHAHIASVMIDHGIENKVIGVSMDGIGLGDDGNIWGAEFFECDLVSYKRKLHFEYMPMPGGDKATKEPWRMAISFLYKAFGDELWNMNIPLLKEINERDIKTVIQLIDKKINSPLASSAGRLFDAVSALLGLTLKAGFHAEAPMKLEAAIDSSIKEKYIYSIQDGVISFTETIKELTKEKSLKTHNGILSAKFHNTVLESIIEGIEMIHSETGIKDIVFSGGTFQNRYLIEKLENKLNAKGFNVCLPNSIPFNDQGIAMGQLAIAAKKRELGLI